MWSQHLPAVRQVKGVDRHNKHCVYCSPGNDGRTSAISDKAFADTPKVVGRPVTRTYQGWINDCFVERQLAEPVLKAKFMNWVILVWGHKMYLLCQHVTGLIPLLSIQIIDSFAIFDQRQPPCDEGELNSWTMEMISWSSSCSNTRMVLLKLMHLSEWKQLWEVFQRQQELRSDGRTQDQAG